MKKSKEDNESRKVLYENILILSNVEMLFLKQK